MLGITKKVSELFAHREDSRFFEKLPIDLLGTWKMIL